MLKYRLFPENTRIYCRIPRTHVNIHSYLSCSLFVLIDSWWITIGVNPALSWTTQTQLPSLHSWLITIEGFAPAHIHPMFLCCREKCSNIPVHCRTLLIQDSFLRPLALFPSIFPLINKRNSSYFLPLSTCPKYPLIDHLEDRLQALRSTSSLATLSTWGSFSVIISVKLGKNYEEILKNFEKI